MPPMYQWCCLKCKEETLIIRTFDEYENPPTKEEHPIECPGQLDHEWKRQIAAPKFVRGAGWRGSKGNW